MQDVVIEVEILGRSGYESAIKFEDLGRWAANAPSGLTEIAVTEGFVSGKNQNEIHTSSNVGIGTDNPDADLHVEGVTRTKYLRFQNLTDATSEVAGMYSSSGAGTNDLTIYASALSSTSSNIKFLTAPTNSAATTTLFLEGSSATLV